MDLQRGEAAMNIRNVRAEDYQPIIRVVNDWWGGRQMTDMLPKLFFVHFCETSFLAEVDDDVVGFVIGFLSQTNPQEAYIHFTGVHPEFRKRGVGRALYGRFCETVQQFNRSQVRCVTSIFNKSSIAYHASMGFQPQSGDSDDQGVSYYRDYDGPGAHRVVFVKQLE